jgi:hypothetical protein
MSMKTKETMALTAHVQIVPIVPIALVKRAGAREEEGIYFIYYTSPSATN